MVAAGINERAAKGSEVSLPDFTEFQGLNGVGNIRSEHDLTWL